MTARSWMGWGALAVVLGAYAGSQKPQIFEQANSAKTKALSLLPGNWGAKFAGSAEAAQLTGAAAAGGAKAAAEVAHGSGGAKVASAPPPAAAKGGLPPAPVLVTKVQTSNIPLRLDGVGSVTARKTVAIKARIDGQLMEAVVQEGQTVKAGDLLFRIDARPFEAALKVAEANLARDKANIEKAKADLARVSDLAVKGYSPKAKYDEAKAGFGTLEASIRADEAAIDAAKLNIEYCVIRSPIGGRVGNLLVHPGNMVKANDTQSLIVVTEMAPVYVSFAVPERYLGEIKRQMHSGKMVVEVWTPDQAAQRIKGELFFMNNAVDPTTGTITLMATVPNADQALMPGQFVQARALLGQLDNVVAVPSRAVQIGQKGTYVYVTRDDLTAELRAVNIGATVDEMSVVTSGLKAGETIVTDGQSRVVPGGKVAPKEPGSAPQAKGGKPKEQS